MAKKTTRLFPPKSSKTALKYTAIEKLQSAGIQLPREYPTEQAAIGDSGFTKMRALMRSLARNSPILCAIVNYVQSFLGADGMEVLWRDSRKPELEKLWRYFCFNCDSTGRFTFSQLENLIIRELCIVGEIAIKLESSGQITLLESERIKEINLRKDGVLESIIVANGDAETKIPGKDIIYIANYSRYSSTRGSPMFAASAGTIMLLSQVITSVGLSWSKVSKHALSVSTGNGASDLPGINNQTPDSIEDGEEKEIEPPSVMETQEATIFIGPQGSTLSPIPQNIIPGSGFMESLSGFVKIVASSCGLSSDSILSQYEKMSYSSARASFQREQATVRQLLNNYKDSFYRPLLNWLLNKWGFEDVDYDLVTSSTSILDPKAEAEYIEKRLSIGISTFEDELLSQNKSRFEHLQQLKQETLDAIKISEEIEQATDGKYRIDYRQFCGKSAGKTEAAILTEQMIQNAAAINTE